MRLVFSFLVLAMILNGCNPTPQAPAAPSVAELKPDFKPTVDARGLMTAIVIPTSDVLFEVGSKPPADEKAWAAVQNAAVTLAESGNLLMIGSRAKPEAAWMQFSRAMTEAAEIAVKAAQDKKVDDVLAAGDKIYMSCENCHNQYMDKGSGGK